MSSDLHERIARMVLEFKPCEMKVCIHKNLVFMGFLSDAGGSLRAIACIIDLEKRQLYACSPLFGGYIEPNEDHKKIAEIFNVTPVSLKQSLKELVWGLRIHG